MAAKNASQIAVRTRLRMSFMSGPAVQVWCQASRAAARRRTAGTPRGRLDPDVRPRGVPAVRRRAAAREAWHHTCTAGPDMKDILNLVRTAIWLAFFAAIYQELKKPAEERT